jgi:hypothetical protein
MATLCFRIKPVFWGPVSLGTTRVIKVLCDRFEFGLTKAKGLVDRAVFGGEEVSVEVPSNELAWQIAGELEKAARPARLRAWVERGRLGQDEAFAMDELVGRRVEKVIGMFRAEAPDDLVVLYVKVDAPPWHRLFLDAGIAFWEDWGRGLENEERDGVVIRDLGASWRLAGDQVRDAGALVSEAHGRSTIIALGFASGARLEAYFADPSSLESSVALSFKRHG